jgi:hypothetical protein
MKHKLRIGLCLLTLITGLLIGRPLVMGQIACIQACLEQLHACETDPESGGGLLIDCQDQYEECIEGCLR